jgi:transcriptional regulator with GAF, ATPase, and Fis domain
MTLFTGTSTPSPATGLPRVFAMFDETIRRVFSEVLNSGEEAVAETDIDVREDSFDAESQTNPQLRRRAAASICREFSAVAAQAADRRAALTEMVRMIANCLEVDTCSVFVLDDHSGDLILAATMGLNQSSVGRVRMRLSQGLVGLVAQELQPVFSENAPKHRRFLLFPEAGEEPYVSFFGVPILLHGNLQGVLVVQTIERRNLSLNWPIVAMAAQRIAPFIKSVPISGFHPGA